MIKFMNWSLCIFMNLVRGHGVMDKAVAFPYWLRFDGPGFETQRHGIITLA